MALAVPRTRPAGIPEVMGFVDDHGVCQFGDPSEPRRVAALAAKIGVTEHREVAEIAAVDPTDVR